VEWEGIKARGSTVISRPCLGKLLKHPYVV
jgi:hypothetical protein